MSAHGKEGNGKEVKWLTLNAQILKPHKVQRLARSDARSYSARSRLRAGQDSGQRAFGGFNGLVRDDFSP